MAKALNQQQREAIEEVFNIGLGRAAMSLSTILGDEVLLNATDIQLLNINTGKALDAIKKNNPGNMVSVAQSVRGDLETLALVIFSEASAVEIVQRMVTKSAESVAVAKYEQEVINEVGNIILNSCISAFSSMMHLTLGSRLPVHHMGDCESVMLDNPVQPLKLMLDLDVIIGMQPIHGYMTFSFSTTSLQVLLHSVGQYFESETFEWLN